MTRFLLICLLVLCRLFSFLRPKLVVRPEGKDYLIRWYLTPCWKWWRRYLPGVFLHCFLSSDPDRGWHSHPWTWAVSLILKGEYCESRPTPYKCFYSETYLHICRKFKPGDLNTLTGADWHQVKLLSPKVWTLFIVGPLHGLEWGFMDEFGTFSPHETDTPGD